MGADEMQYWGNRLCTEAADRAIQVHGELNYRAGEHLLILKGGIGYSRHKQ